MHEDIVLTPMMKQFLDLKAKHPDAVMLFRCGDFYETYSTDAVVASEILGITLTKRANGKGKTIEMAGFPHHALDTYLPKLIRAGKRVAICDQLEDPKLTKKLVKRGITELVTPGVSINDNVLNYRENNFLAAVHFGKGACGVAFLDISTGEFLTAEGPFDYVDSHIPKFDKMYVARLKAYKKIGYELCVNMDGKKQKANAIYDIENYAETYWKDLEEANSAVVVSSPRLNNQKVDRIINMLGKRRELGVKVTIVTWHPDAYKYGKDDVRMELMERLRKAGFEIRLVEETCEHYAVIDNEIVWYGSVNLLSKEDAEDNLMRVCSKDIAAELLEMTFGSEVELQEW